MDIQMLESELLKLSPKDRASIINRLLASLDAESSEDFEDVWISEALSRYKSAEKNSLDANLVIREAKSKYE